MSSISGSRSHAVITTDLLARVAFSHAASIPRKPAVIACHEPAFSDGNAFKSPGLLVNASRSPPPNRPALVAQPNGSIDSHPLKTNVNVNTPNTRPVM